MKIYYLGRVNLKAFKNTPGMPIDRLVVQDYYLEGSNIFSTAECLLLRWLEVHLEAVRPNLTKRLLNFDEDVRDCLVFATAIQSYVGVNASKSLV
jgi:hypothetical protein